MSGVDQRVTTVKDMGIPPFRCYPGILNAGAITAFASVVRLRRIFMIG